MKKFTCVFFAVLFIISAAACSKGEQKSEPDIQSIADELISSDVFIEKLEPIDGDLGEVLYEIDPDDVSEALFYFSSGATAEELSLFKAADKDAAERIAAALERRVELQSNSFASYIPSEVPKLESADIRVFGSTVILCVSSDSETASELLDKYF